MTTAQPIEFQSLALARFRNFFYPGTPWQRSLWTIGTIGGLCEVVEYAEVGSTSELSNEGMKYVAASMLQQVEKDPGLGTASTREEIRDCLEQFARPGSGTKAYPRQPELARLRHLADRCSDGYVNRWVDALERGAAGVERFTRSVAAHLLDMEFSPGELQRWLEESGEHDLTGFLEKAVEGPQTGLKPWNVCIPIRRLPESLLGQPGWTSATQTREWLRQRGWALDGERINGCFLATVHARDAFSAVHHARELVTRSASRLALARRRDGEIGPVGWARVDGEPNKFSLVDYRSSVAVPNLARPAILAAVGRYEQAEKLDNAIELASAMNQANPGAAITGGWAAIESLLLSPEEMGGQVAADRMASIIACSFARADLQALANRLSRQDDDLGHRMKGLRSYERARLLESMLRDGQDMSFAYPTDRAAVSRVREVLSCTDVLQRVRGYIANSLRRLYNQRNLVMHAGNFGSCALRITLRTAPALVGAGLDRVAHAAFDPRNPVDPLHLAARADTELRLVGSSGGRWLVDLLE